MSSESAPASLVGVVLRFASLPPLFVSIDAAPRLCRLPPVTKVPGAPAECLGISMTEDGVVPVIALGPARQNALFCREDDQSALLVGFDEAHTGAFPAGNSGVTMDGEVVARLDLQLHLSTIVRNHRGGSA